MESEETMSGVRKVPMATFISMLRSDIVKFKFEKKDGTIRIAFGTRNPKIISAVIGTTAAHDGTKKPPRVGFVTYFDLDKKTFRCFAEERFLGVMEEHAHYEPETVVEHNIVDFSTFTMINEMLDCDCECEDDEEE